MFNILLIIISSAFGLISPYVKAQLVDGAFLPLFVDPQSDCSGWSYASGAISADPEVKVFTVINPSNGPGLAYSQPSHSYRTCIPTLIAAGSMENTLHLLGYVDTENGQRSSEDVIADIETYAGWHAKYRPVGIYFDNAASGEEDVNTYETYTSAVRSLFGGNSLVVLNPSTLPYPGYFEFSDLIVTVNEDYNAFNYTNLSSNISPATPASKQIVILYNAPALYLTLTVVDEISEIAEIRACFLTSSPKETEYNSVPDDWSTLLGLLVGSQTA